MKTTIKGLQSDYAYHIGEGLLAKLDELVDSDVPSFLIVDGNIPSSFIRSVEKNLSSSGRFTVTAGEASKTIHTYELIIDALQEEKMPREGRIVALGGGMVNDLAGFVAATYKRGVRLLLLPTSLIAMADASVGGKFALNTSRSKNAIGTFYTPEAVVADTSTLESLPERELASGMAEIVKIALLKDAGLFDRLKRETVSLRDAHLIKKAVELKRDIVENDPCDRGGRALLNYGHTIAHALEHLHAGAFLHGECVAFGMRLMAKDKPFWKDLEKVLASFGLDKDIPYDKEELAPFLRQDKKRRKDDIYVLADVEEPGNGFLKRLSFNDFLKRIPKGGPS